MGFIWDLDDWQQNVGEWAEKTFPQSTQDSIIKHLQHEANVELMPDCDPEELADVALLLLHLAHKRGISLVQEMRNKFHRNQQRKWGEKNSQGFQEHLPEATKTQ